MMIKIPAIQRNDISKSMMDGIMKNMIVAIAKIMRAMTRGHTDIGRMKS